MTQSGEKQGLRNQSKSEGIDTNFLLAAGAGENQGMRDTQANIRAGEEEREKIKDLGWELRRRETKRKRRNRGHNGDREAVERESRARQRDRATTIKERAQHMKS